MFINSRLKSAFAVKEFATSNAFTENMEPPSISWQQIISSELEAFSNDLLIMLRQPSEF